MSSYETIHAYFEALVAGDAETLIDMMLTDPYYVKIGTDADEIVKGGENIAAYYKNHVASTEDFSITFLDFDMWQQGNVAWFYTRQRWRLKWQGTQEEFVMRITGVLEQVGWRWKFAQIHASIGV